VVVGVLFILILFGCASQKPLWGDPESGLILTYRPIEGSVSKYHNTVEVTQILKMAGQPMKTVINTDMDLTLTSKEKNAENLVLGIRVDKIDVNMSSPQGKTSPETSGILGKDFDMTLSPLGRELNLGNAAALTYQTSPFAKGSVEPIFARFFPDLPSHPVRVGDTWTSTTDTSSDDGSAKIHTVMEHVNVIDGFETVDGMECVRVTAKMAGTMEGKGNQMGSDFTLSGKLEGIATWYFAYKEGLFVNRTMKFTGDVDIKGAMGSIPMTLVNVEDTKLVK